MLFPLHLYLNAILKIEIKNAEWLRTEAELRHGKPKHTKNPFGVGALRIAMQTWRTGARKRAQANLCQ